MRPFALSALLALPVLAQTDAHSVAAYLNPVSTPAVVASELRHSLMRKVPALPAADSADAWTSQAKQLRSRFLKEIVFHGWPVDWVNAAPRFEDVGLIPSDDTSYRMRKLRYEIVPGFWSTAILYEPAKLSGKAPVILNPHGNAGAPRR